VKKLDLNCPCCADSIVKSYDGEVKMRSKLIKWNNAGMYAICKSCGTEVTLNPDLLRSIESSFTYEVSTTKNKSTHGT
jgi:ribosomal protein S27E